MKTALKIKSLKAAKIKVILTITKQRSLEKMKTYLAPRRVRAKTSTRAERGATRP